MSNYYKFKSNHKNNIIRALSPRKKKSSKKAQQRN